MSSISIDIEHFTYHRKYKTFVAPFWMLEKAGFNDAHDKLPTKVHIRGKTKDVEFHLNGNTKMTSLMVKKDYKVNIDSNVFWLYVTEDYHKFCDDYAIEFYVK